MVVAQTTIASNTAAITFYPGLEAAVASTAWALAFTKSSLRPQDEDAFAELAAGRLSVSKSLKFANTITFGGGNVAGTYQEWGERRLAQALRKLQGQTRPKVNSKAGYSQEF